MSCCACAAVFSEYPFEYFHGYAAKEIIQINRPILTEIRVLFPTLFFLTIIFIGHSQNQIYERIYSANLSVRILDKLSVWISRTDLLTDGRNQTAFLPERL